MFSFKRMRRSDSSTSLSDSQVDMESLKVEPSDSSRKSNLSDEESHDTKIYEANDDYSIYDTCYAEENNYALSKPDTYVSTSLSAPVIPSSNSSSSALVSKASLFTTYSIQRVTDKIKVVINETRTDLRERLYYVNGGHEVKNDSIIRINSKGDLFDAMGNLVIVYVDHIKRLWIDDKVNLLNSSEATEIVYRNGEEGGSYCGTRKVYPLIHIVLNYNFSSCDNARNKQKIFFSEQEYIYRSSTVELSHRPAAPGC